MLWIIPAWMISCTGFFFLGFYIRGITQKVAQLEQSITLKADKQVAPNEPVSTLIDPTDEVQTALYEHNKLMERINGK